MARGSQSFATFLILCPTSFFLGLLFSLFPYDYPLLWTSTPPTPQTFTVSENHLLTLHASPPLIPRILHIVIFLGLLGFFTKLYKPSDSNLLFDGASLVLYICGIIVYITNIVKGLRVVSGGDYTGGVVEGEGAEFTVGREDSLRVLAASDAILALVLVGVLVLQAGQWYAERKDRQMEEKIEKEEKEGKAAGGGRIGAGQRVGSGKKKA